MSRILKNCTNQITKGYKKGSHNGIDIVGYKSKLDSIIAHTDGKVVFINKYNKRNILATGNNSYGNCVKIKHANGMYTLYAHLSNINVRLGENVTKGTVIGYMGSTGRTFGAHLHFEVRNVSDIRIDPTSYIDSSLPNETNKKYCRVIAKSGLWCRKGIGYKFSKLKVLPYGLKAELLIFNAGSSNGYNWAKIKYNNQVLYVPNKWIEEL